MWISIFFMSLTMLETTGSKAEMTKKFFNDFSYEKLDSLNEFYAEDIHFVDPIGEHRGLASLRDYYAGMYKNVKSIRFDFSESLQQGDTLVLFWSMNTEHSALNSGKPFSVEGVSHIRFDPQSGKATYHRDYFDAGELLYENIPVLGRLIGFIRNKAAGK